MSTDAIVGNGAPGFEWKGHTTRLLDLAALSRYERKVFGNHFKALQEMRDFVTEEQYDRLLSETQNNKAAGLYSLKGRMGAPWAATADGLAFLLSLILDYDGEKKLDGWAVYRCDPQAAEELIQQVMKDSGVISDEMLRFAEKKKAARDKEQAARPFRATPTEPAGSP